MNLKHSQNFVWICWSVLKPQKPYLNVPEYTKWKKKTTQIKEVPRPSCVILRKVNAESARYFLKVSEGTELCNFSPPVIQPFLH